MMVMVMLVRGRRSLTLDPNHHDDDDHAHGDDDDDDEFNGYRLYYNKVMPVRGRRSYCSP